MRTSKLCAVGELTACRFLYQNSSSAATPSTSLRMAACSSGSVGASTCESGARGSREVRSPSTHGSDERSVYGTSSGPSEVGEPSSVVVTSACASKPRSSRAGGRLPKMTSDAASTCVPEPPSTSWRKGTSRIVRSCVASISSLDAERIRCGPLASVARMRLVESAPSSPTSEPEKRPGATAVGAASPSPASGGMEEGTERCDTSGDVSYRRSTIETSMDTLPPAKRTGPSSFAARPSSVTPLRPRAPPLSRRYSTTRTCLERMASSSGVPSQRSTGDGSAPASIRKLTASRCPLDAARCSAVRES
mmetsp:Transcript_10504/g.26438  ORF Transcript_10504/g.26438 Transcript_10504/m.26438 type:complete len:306 (+) Transcript_10504:2486-3403(+)